MTLPLQDPLKVNKFLGLVNTFDPLQAPKGSLLVADNVDIDNANSVRRRRGYTGGTASYTDIQAAFATKNQESLYIIDAGNLLSVNTDFSHEIIDTGYPQGVYFFEEVGNRIYLSGPKKSIILSGVVRPWGVEVPNPPIVTTIAGSVPAGRYHIACTYRNSFKEESGSSLPVVVELQSPGAFSLSIPQTPDHTTVLYISSTNGEVMYKAVETVDSSIVWDGPIGSLVSPLSPEQQKAIRIPPTITNIAYSESRMYGVEVDASSDTSYIYFSAPFWLGLFDIFSNYEAIPGIVRMLESYEGGLVIATGREIYTYNIDRGLNLEADYGVPEGIQSAKDPNGVVYFWTYRGVCRIPEFTNLTQNLVSVPAGDKCYTAFIEQEGYNKFLVSTTDSGLPNNIY